MILEITQGKSSLPGYLSVTKECDEEENDKEKLLGGAFKQVRDQDKKKGFARRATLG